ncbi:hypothetical protein PINS_up012394 [Pythium insidiosum]|nr:hypothetical protein PINS_up012394 [Pythium insidiosum]
MEALLVRIDHFRDRKQYVDTLRAWITEIGIEHGRLVTMGEIHLLLVHATAKQNAELLEFYRTKTIDLNNRDEPCIDRFIDIVARQQIETEAFKGFLEINLLNAALLEKMMVSEWGCEKAWLDDAQSTPRSKALLKWREEAKAQRRDQRKRAAAERYNGRVAKRAKASEASEAGEENGSAEKSEDAATEADAATEPSTSTSNDAEQEGKGTSVPPPSKKSPQGPHRPQQKKKKKQKSGNGNHQHHSKGSSGSGR